MRAGDDKLASRSDAEAGATPPGSARERHEGVDVGMGEGEGMGQGGAGITTGLYPAAGVSASADFLAGYGEDTTDVVEHPTSPGVKLERQYILTVVAGPQTGFARVIDGGELVLGRGYGSDLLLVDQGLSRRHCRVWKSGDEMRIEDLGSSNGTFVDGEMVLGPRRLPEGARIHMGRHTLLTLSRQDPLEHEAARQLFETSMRDPLTDLYNRRFFDQRLREEFAFASRHHTSLSVILLDLDHFKRVNDTWGHPAGDEVLREVGGLVRGCFRREDVAFRLGGEEFAVVVRSESHEGACAAAERIRRTLEDARVSWEGEEIRFTGSAGVATATPGEMLESASALLAAADRALYRAKAGGRNRVEG
jgi:two-component system cell cycle response regulator